MLPPTMEGKIEDNVTLDLQYPSVIERYWTKHYFIPKEKKPWSEKGMPGDEKETETVKEGMVEVESALKGDETVEKMRSFIPKEKKPGSNGDEKETETVKEGTEEDETALKGGETVEKMDVEYNTAEEEKEKKDQVMEGSQGEEEGRTEQARVTPPSRPDNSGHVCVMVHTNKLCLVTLAPTHPALAPGMQITQVSYAVGKFNRLDNQVSGKGKRGAQMMGPQSPVCILTCADGSRHTVLAGVHGKLVEVNERLVDKPSLVSERPDAEGYLAVILPPLRSGDAPLKRLVTSEQYWAQEGQGNTSGLVDKEAGVA